LRDAKKSQNRLVKAAPNFVICKKVTILAASALQFTQTGKKTTTVSDDGREGKYFRSKLRAAAKNYLGRLNVQE